MSSSSFSRHGAVDLSAAGTAGQAGRSWHREPRQAGTGSYVVEATEQTFEAEAIRKSVKHPVVVELYSPRVATGQKLSDALAALADRESAGRVPAGPGERRCRPRDRPGTRAAGGADGDRGDRRAGRPAVPGRAEQGPGPARTSSSCSRPRSPTGSSAGPNRWRRHQQPQAEPERAARVRPAIRRRRRGVGEGRLRGRGRRVRQAAAGQPERCGGARPGTAQAGLLGPGSSSSTRRGRRRRPPARLTWSTSWPLPTRRWSRARRRPRSTGSSRSSRRSSGDDRNTARVRLLELFETLGTSDPRVLKARRDLMAALLLIDEASQAHSGCSADRCGWTDVKRGLLGRAPSTSSCSSTVDRRQRRRQLATPQRTRDAGERQPGSARADAGHRHAGVETA